MQYIFDSTTKTHYTTDDILTWAAWFESEERHLFKTEIDGVLISTVFLGIDHAFGGQSPILYETMVFKGGSLDDELTLRYATYDEAAIGHEQTVEAVRVWLARQREDRQLHGGDRVALAEATQ